MQPEPRQLCKLRPEIVDLDVKDAMALVLGCKLADAEAYRRLERKHGELVDWISEPARGE